MLDAETMQMRVSTGTNALLTIAMVNYPGWRATINGEPVQIVDNYAGLIGIPMTEGEDQLVRVWFVDERVRQGAVVSLAALVVSILLGFVAWRDLLRQIAVSY